MMNIDDPRFPDLLTRAVWRAEIRDNPDVFLMAGGHQVAQQKARLILEELRAVTRRAGAL